MFQAMRREYSMDAEFTAANLEADAPIVRSIFKIYPNKTAIGGDHLDFTHAANLPDVALDQWGQLLNHSVGSFSLPKPELLNSLALFV